MEPTIVSAPGKVLLAGGYLVLDQKYSGLVVSTSSRFYTAVEGGSGKENVIRVRSPQFQSASWNYTVELGSCVKVLQEEYVPIFYVYDFVCRPDNQSFVVLHQKTSLFTLLCNGPPLRLFTCEV